MKKEKIIFPKLSNVQRALLNDNCTLEISISCANDISVRIEKDSKLRTFVEDACLMCALEAADRKYGNNAEQQKQEDFNMGSKCHLDNWVAKNGKIAIKKDRGLINGTLLDKNSSKLFASNSRTLISVLKELNGWIRNFENQNR